MNKSQHKPKKKQTKVKARRNRTMKACALLVETTTLVCLARARDLIGDSKEVVYQETLVLEKLNELLFSLGYYDGFIDECINKKKKNEA